MTADLKDRWFDDFRVGEQLAFGDYLITEEEIVDFARRYDPQPFHLDHEAARASHFGGLVASGWMTSSVLMRLMVDHFIPRQASMGSPGRARCSRLAWRCGCSTGSFPTSPCGPRS